MNTPCSVTCEVSRVVLFGKMYTPPPLGKHAGSQQNNGPTGSHAYTSPCLRATGSTIRVYVKM